MAFSPAWRLGRWGLFLFLLALPATSGCGVRTATVTGKVSYNNKPVKGGQITFVSTEKKPTISGQINEDGSYTLENVPVGSVKVCVATSSLNPARKPKEMKYSPPPGMKAPEGLGSGSSQDMSKRYVPIPLKYENSETTPLTYTVTSGSQEFEVKLVD